MKLSLTIVLAAALLAAAPARANVIYDVTFSGGGVNGTAQVVTSSALNPAGGYDILSFDGSENGQSLSLIGGDPETPTYSACGCFIYDNIFYPASNGLVDYWGVLFTVNSIPGSEGNIYFDPGSDQYWLYLWSADTGYYVATPIAFADPPRQVPEPGMLAVLGGGLAGLGALRRRRKALKAI